MIFLRHWRPKQCQEAIAAKFDEAPRIALQYLLHRCEHRLREPLHRFRAQTQRQSQGIRQAATEHRYLFVFPSQRQRRRATSPQRDDGVLLTPCAGDEAAGMPRHQQQTVAEVCAGRELWLPPHRQQGCGAALALAR